MMIVECETRRQIDLNKIAAKSHIPIVFSHLSPLVAALRVHEGHLNVVSSVRLVVVVPLQPTMHLLKNIPNKNESFKHHTYTSKTKFHNYQDMLVNFLYRCILINLNLAAKIVSHSLLRLVRPLLSHQRFSWKRFLFHILHATSTNLFV